MLAGNKPPFQLYWVTLQLTTGLWQQSKMADNDAFEKYVLQQRDVKRHV